jgi:type IV secretion system protein TrbL
MNNAINTGKTQTLLYWLGSLCIMLVLPAMANAQVQSNNFLNTIVDEYRHHAAQWTPVMLSAAKRLFWLLAAIECTWMAILLGLRRADMTEWVAELVRHLMFIGFFYAVLLHSGAWSSAIVESLRQLASDANASAGGTSGISPATVFDIGLTIALKLSDAYSFWAPGASLGLAIAVLITAICFALIAAFLVIALVEMYIVLNAGVILLGLDASRWTSDYAVKYLTYAFSVGMKLFVLQLLIGLGEVLMTGWAKSVETHQDQVFAIVGGAVVMLALVYAIPNLIQSLITGVSTGSGQPMTAALGAIGGAAMGAAIQGAGAGSAAYQATRLAQAEGTTGMWSVARAASAHLATQAGSDLVGKLSGGNRFGTMGGRMGERLAQERQRTGEGVLDGNTISAALWPPSSGMSQMPSAGQPPPATDHTYHSGVRPEVNPSRDDGGGRG